MRHALLLSLVVACSSSSSTPTSKPQPPSTSPASTGPLSEAEFKALHDVPTGTAPVGKGVKVDLPGGTKAYLAVPAGPGPHPGIVVIHEWWGLNGHIEVWADRLASAGWAALAVDLYAGTVATDRDTAMAAMKAVDETKAAATIHAGLEFLKSDERTKSTTLAVIGWCFGGGWALQTGLAEPELAGVVMYYGRLVTDPAKLRAIKAKLLGVFGKQDDGIPPAEVAKFEAGLKEAGVSAQIYSYDAAHAFANPSNPKYDEANAADAWTKVLAFLDGLAHRR